MGGHPLVTVLMSVYNGESHLRESINCIINQSFTDFEFVIINDGSTDRTSEIIRSYNDKRIIIHEQNNLGLTKSLNIGVSLALGKYIARHDVGDISKPERLKKQVSFLEQNPSVALLSTGAEFIDSHGNFIWDCLPPEDNETLQKQLIKICQFAHPTVMFRRSIMDSVGLYREYFKYAQDYDLWLRIAEKGELASIHEPLVCCRDGEGGISESKIYLQTLYAGVAIEMARQRRTLGYDDIQSGKTPTFSSVSALTPELVDKLTRYYENNIDLLIAGIHETVHSEDYEFILRKLVERLVSEKQQMSFLHKSEVNDRELRISDLQAQIYGLKNSLTWRVFSPVMRLLDKVAGR